MAKQKHDIGYQKRKKNGQRREYLKFLVHAKRASLRK
jgi:hypothetical protein